MATKTITINAERKYYKSTEFTLEVPVELEGEELEAYILKQSKFKDKLEEGITSSLFRTGEDWYEYTEQDKVKQFSE